MNTHRFALPCLVALAILVAPAHCPAAAKVATCVRVKSPDGEVASLQRLVESEVDRHATHRTARRDCAVHLEVEIIDVGGTRFITGRMGGEVPERVRMEGKTGKELATALGALLTVVLGSDPVSLGHPSGESWFEERALALRDRGYSTLDVSLLEGVSVLDGQTRFQPGLQIGYSREIASIQLGVEALVLQSLAPRGAALTLDTQIGLGLAASYFLSETADAAAFAGVTLGVLHQRFSGPRSERAGGGEGLHYATGPAVGLRAGVELFRTTAIRALVFAEGRLPLFAASDSDSEVVDAWVPTLSLGAGVRF